MSLESTGASGFLKQRKLFTHKFIYIYSNKLPAKSHSLHSGSTGAAERV